MAKPEWGTKRTCPKCSGRFYDLGKMPVICIACGYEWVPEPILKSKQPQPEPVKKAAAKENEEAATDEDELIKDADIDLDVEIEDDDDDVLEDTVLEEDDDVADVIEKPVEKDES